MAVLSYIKNQDASQKVYQKGKHKTKHKISRNSRCISKEGEPLHGGICHRFLNFLLAYL